MAALFCNYINDLLKRKPVKLSSGPKRIADRYDSTHGQILDSNEHNFVNEKHITIDLSNRKMDEMASQLQNLSHKVETLNRTIMKSESMIDLSNQNYQM